jgi:hypothetical protein
MRDRVFLLIAGAGVLLVFGLPILFAPYDWADAFGWDTRPHTDLTTYFARVVGALVTALATYALYASRDPARHRSLFTLIAGIAGLMAFVHLWGIGAQPASETVEVAFYAGFAALALWARPAMAA